MARLRNLTPAEIAEAETLGSSADDWTQVMVSEDFRPGQLRASRLEGRVEIASGARIVSSRVRNYRIGEDSLVEQVTALECRHESAFGNGTPVAAMNECGGRTVRICDLMSAQAAYATAVYRHRPQTVAALERMTESVVRARRSAMGSVGRGCRIVGARFVREMRIGDGATIDGASRLEEGTLAEGAAVGADVKASHFIAAEGARLDNGAIVERCFVGENCILSNGFTAVDSLFFANSHCENGEAASVFAGPFTVSHHKSSLLIAGMFSFFNAGSGANQSNHLFKSGAVHQSVHLRGCKFGSGAYIMSPAIEGPFTIVLGHHSSHHDTSEFPYSYLVEKEERSMLMPGANLTSCGAVRDIEKWVQRDRRRVRRDVVDFAEYNPYVCSGFVAAVNTLHALAEADPDAGSYNHRKVVIKANMLRRGIGLYNKAVVASMGAMLARGASAPDADGSAPRSLQLLSPAAAGRILEVHRRLLSLRRRERWLTTASVAVDEATLNNTWAQIVLTPAADDGAAAVDGERPAPLVLVLNLGDEARPAPGEVLEAVSGADMLDAVGPAADGTVPAHGIAVVR